MSSSEPAKVIASVFGLAAFAVAIIAGLSVQNPPARVLGTALVGMFICHILGMCVGLVGERVVADHIARVKAGSAAPESKPAAPTGAPGQTA